MVSVSSFGFCRRSAWIGGFFSTNMVDTSILCDFAVQFKFMVQKIKQLIEQGESQTVEFKTCQSNLSGSVFETVSSFSNRYGGYIIIGVDDSGKIIGVNESSLPGMKRNFSNMLNNRQKISPSLFLELNEIVVDGKHLLYAYVPSNSETIFCANRVYDRIGDADVDITNNTSLMSELYLRKSSAFSERKIFPYLKDEHFNWELIERARRMAVNKSPEHPWGKMSDMEIARSAGLRV